MSNRQVSLLPFAARTPQPRIRTPRGNFRYSAWTAFLAEISGANVVSVAEIDNVSNPSGVSLRLFLFGSDNVARGTICVGDQSTNFFATGSAVLTTRNAFTAASADIVPETAAAPSQSVVATVNGVPNVRGVLAEQSLGGGDFPGTTVVFVDVAFDSGVIAGRPNFFTGNVRSRPVLLLASQFTQDIVDAGYTYTDATGSTSVIVGVWDAVNNP